MILKALFNFNSLVDINLSILKLLKHEYGNPEYLTNGLLLSDDYTLKSMLLENKDQNPISIFLKDEYLDNADDLYDQLLNDNKLKYYYEFTGIITVYRTFIIMDTIQASILCKSEEEKEILLKLNPNFSNIIVSEDMIDINGKTDIIYIGNVKDMKERFIFPEGLEFRILRYGYNMESIKGRTLPILKYCKDIVDHNNISLVDPYTNFIKPRN